MEDTNSQFFKKDTWKGILIALIILIGGEAVLVWQYHRLEKQRLPRIEQELLEQKREIQKKEAEETVKSFLDLRLAKDEKRASRYLTERTMQKREEGTVTLLPEFDMETYQILKRESIDENAFRFEVELLGEQGQLLQIEILRLIKILDEYYIDSIELAG